MSTVLFILLAIVLIKFDDTEAVCRGDRARELNGLPGSSGTGRIRFRRRSE